MNEVQSKYLKSVLKSNIWVNLFTTPVSHHCKLLPPLICALLTSLPQLWSSKNWPQLRGRPFLGCPISPPHFLWSKMLQVKFWQGSWLQVRFGLPFIPLHFHSLSSLFSALLVCQWTDREGGGHKGREMKEAELHCLHVGTGLELTCAQQPWIVSRPWSFQTADARRRRTKVRHWRCPAANQTWGVGRLQVLRIIKVSQALLLY